MFDRLFAVWRSISPSSSPSGRNLALKCKQSPLGNQQIGQTQQREQLCAVLGQTPVVRLAQPEPVLDDVERMFDPGTDGAPSVARSRHPAVPTQSSAGPCAGSVVSPRAKWRQLIALPSSRCPDSRHRQRAAAPHHFVPNSPCNSLPLYCVTARYNRRRSPAHCQS